MFRVCSNYIVNTIKAGGNIFQRSNLLSDSAKKSFALLMNEGSSDILVCFIFTPVKKNISTSTCVLATLTHRLHHGMFLVTKVSKNQWKHSIRIRGLHGIYNKGHYIFNYICKLSTTHSISTTFYKCMCIEGPFWFFESWFLHICQHTIARVSGLGEKVGGGWEKQFCKENWVQFRIYSSIVICDFQKDKSRAIIH